jgi:hypothetical protein
MATQVLDSALSRGQQSPPISHRCGSPGYAAPDRAQFFRKRRIFKAFTAICAVAATMAYVPFAHARDHKSDDHARHAHRMVFDGRWSVVIETKRGTCDSYRVGLDIVNGTVTYDGNPYGRVSTSGLIRISGAMGGQSAQGTGRLSRTSGQGVWRALVNTGTCDGHWMAERRDRGAL